jgi:uracil-DNA glycosylase family 4
MTLSSTQRAAAEAHLRFARDLGIFDLYQRPVDAAQAAQWAADALTSEAALEIEAQVDVPAAPFAQKPIAIQEPTIARAQISVIANIPFSPYTGGDKVAALHALQQEIGLCMRCPLATQGRHTVVFADGDPDAELMFVGEGPGADEDEQGLPFVGRAGQLLNNMITAMGTTRQQVYIANIVKCRPPKNRAPEPVEANTCLPFLLRQYDIVQPKVVVALGATAATYLTGAKLSLGSQRGRLHDFRGAKLLITYHPAFLLRDPRQKKETWADLQIAMQYLGMTPARN